MEPYRRVDLLFCCVVVLSEEDVVDGGVRLGRVLGPELNDGSPDVLEEELDLDAAVVPGLPDQGADEPLVGEVGHV